MVVRELITKLGFKTDKAGLARAEKGFKTLRNTALGVGAAVAGLGTALGFMLKRFANNADVIAKTAPRVGLSTTEFQKLAFAADLAGADQETLNVAMTRFARVASDAQRGLSTAVDALADLGITVDDGSGKLRPMNELLFDAIDAFSGMEDGAKKAALAQETFGRGGAKLINFFNEGSDKVREYGELLAALGGIIDEKTLAASEEFNDSITKMGAFTTGLKTVLAAELLPIINETIENIITWMKANGELVREDIKRWVQGLARALKTLFQLIQRGLSFLRRFVSAIGGVERAVKLAAGAIGLLIGFKVVKGFIDLSTGLITVVRGFKLLGNAALIAQAKVLAIPILVAAAIAAIVLLVQDIISAFQGKDSLIGRLVEPFEKFKNFIRENFVLDILFGPFLDALDFVSEAIIKLISLIPGGKKFLGIDFEPVELTEEAKRRIEQRERERESPAALPMEGALPAPIITQTPIDLKAMQQSIEGLGLLNLPPPAPILSEAPVTNNNEFNMQSKIEINVTEPNASARDVAKEVDRQVRETFGGMLRQTRRAVEAGAL